MRISDWSSDVCSSDLHEYRDRLPVLIRGDAHGAQQQLLTSRVVAQHQVIPATPQPIRHIQHRCQRAAKRAHADTLAVTLEHPLRGRSEEHTSELQSLMRISYAVFCLKKKTTYSKESEP